MRDLAKALDQQRGRNGAKRSYRPRYVDRVEVPAVVKVRDEGEIRVWGSGMWEAEMSSPSILVRVPVAFRQGKPLWVQPAHVREEAVMALRKVVEQPAVAQGGEGVVAAGGSYPNIWEYLAMTKYPDGKPRETAALIVVGEGETWKVCLSDKDNGRVMWKAGASLEEAIVSLELGLIEDNPSDWRKSASTSVKKRR